VFAILIAWLDDIPSVLALLRGAVVIIGVMLINAGGRR
jgi:hypothetical protein